MQGFKPTISEAKRKAPTNVCKIYFLDKDVELTDVPHTFHDPSLKVFLPTDTPTVVYSVTNPIRSKYLILTNLFLI